MPAGRGQGASSSAPSTRWPSRRGSTSPSISRRDASAGDSHRRQRLQQVLKNLLSNAFKFTEEGGVTLTVRQRREGASLRRTARSTGRGRVIAFAVTDTGIGIREGQAAADLRGVPAGRRHDEPQVRRHGPRPLDQPRDRAAARRRDPRRERRGKGSTFTLFLPARYVEPERGPRLGQTPSRAGTSSSEPPGRAIRSRRRRRRRVAARSHRAIRLVRRRRPTPRPSRDQRKKPAGDVLPVRARRRRSSRADDQSTTTARRSSRATAWC